VRCIEKILKDIKSLVDEEISKYIPKKSNTLLEGSWRYFRYGGKRFRPTLLALSCMALGGNIEYTIPAGAALEVAHTYFIIHDDIEDLSKIRRGKPCLHTIYGIPHAINIGDYLLAKSYEVLLSGKRIWGCEKTIKILNYFTEMIRITTEGQAMEIDQRDRDLSEATMDWYRTMVLNKTGYYSGGIPCTMGGIIANATEQQIEALKDFGFAVGVAFQIHDDVLNLIPDKKENIGKEFADDIKEGKRTLLIIHAFNHANRKEKDRMRQLVGKKDITLEEKMEVIEIMKKYKSIQYTKEYSKRMIRKAIEKLKQKIPPTDGRKKLEELAWFVVNRKT